ncbi:MAG: energy transducer TonB [Candidatus Synoicihabitans palmerolidicus]|nr:energy transducer TonB [Candidatus Synoicihabitans palmerolidicus]
MRDQGVGGRATISMTIDKTGAVRDLQTVSTSEEVFAEAALAAVSQWQFEPGQLAGLPVNTRMQLPFIFNISKEPSHFDDWF